MIILDIVIVILRHRVVPRHGVDRFDVVRLDDLVRDQYRLEQSSGVAEGLSLDRGAEEVSKAVIVRCGGCRCVAGTIGTMAAETASAEAVGAAVVVIVVVIMAAVIAVVVVIVAAVGFSFHHSHPPAGVCGGNEIVVAGGGMVGTAAIAATIIIGLTSIVTVPVICRAVSFIVATRATSGGSILFLFLRLRIIGTAARGTSANAEIRQRTVPSIIPAKIVLIAAIVEIHLADSGGGRPSSVRGSSPLTAAPRGGPLPLQSLQRVPPRLRASAVPI
mmetsp:Transcript_6150/g.13495  ORF Transcript_6150/g.13495 Transcript_6150/m.13495 type:complete len:275 (-) Transcript_6150:22-846(-)